jgi:hypothetical protein
VSATDHGIASRAFRPDAQAAARGAGHAATFATTEHFNLQVSRAITVSEANGRASIYLAALSSNLIALAFIGQMSQLGMAFYAFALILLPVLTFVGTVTFLRLVQSSIEDIAYAPGSRSCAATTCAARRSSSRISLPSAAHRARRCTKHHAHGS